MANQGELVAEKGTQVAFKVCGDSGFYTIHFGKALILFRCLNALESL